LHRHTAGSRASAKFLHRPARSLRRTISLLSTFGAVAGVQLQTSRSIKPRERDLGDLRLFFLARFLTRPTNHPRHAACASNFKSKPVRPRKFRTNNIQDGRKFAKPVFRRSWLCNSAKAGCAIHPNARRSTIARRKFPPNRYRSGCSFRLRLRCSGPEQG
jgi:hypothetical protein